MNRRLAFIFTCTALLLGLAGVIFRGKEPNLKLERLKQEYAIFPVPSVDHARLPQLNRNFASPQEVTLTCIGCHTERHKEVMASSHWNWERVEYIEGRGLVAGGKKNSFNNFCISASSNEQTCAKCHIGFGMANAAAFDFGNGANVDCMVCHDNSAEYQKGSQVAGYPDRRVNLTNVARSVGAPQKMNCGSCHFYSGGGNNVKHGDLEEALLSTTRDVDVHMAANGMDMSCVTCHTAENHVMKGKLYSVSSENVNRATCAQCHGEVPHTNELLNRHYEKVACQTCHIPYYAKVNATKTDWRWSAAGELRDGEPFTEKDEDGNITYLSKKGRFQWGKNLKPDYLWFNGTADHYFLGDRVEPGDIPVQINTLNGSHDDPESKIFPVKIHRGDQIWDPEHRMLIQPKLVAAHKGEGAFWKDFDWDSAAREGMRRVGLPYSGKFDFVETEMYWPVNHMVSPAKESLACNDCHSRSDAGRLAKLKGFYLPGRDTIPFVEIVGKGLVLLTLIAVLLHASLRVRGAYRRKASAATAPLGNRKGGEP